jgi:hypothetical protein
MNASGAQRLISEQTLNGDRTMAMKLIAGAALLACTAVSTLATTTPTLAQGVYGARYYGYYDYAPVPFRQARRSHNFYGPVATPDVDRGGPGPRVGAGSGMGIGAER